MSAIEIVFNFDTTGSIYPVLQRIRSDIEKTIGELLKDYSDLRIGLGANGDYCDLRPYGYVTKQIDLTRDIFQLANFARNVGPTGGGGNGGEAYELVLQQAQDVFSWSLNSKKILVMIGDEIAHTPEYHRRNGLPVIDWKEQAKSLRKQGIEIHTIQCLSRYEAPPYYKELADLGGGLYLRMDQFNDITTLVQGIIHNQYSREAVELLEERVMTSGRQNRSLQQSFNVLLGRPRDHMGRFISTKGQAPTSVGLVPVQPGRFQMMTVPSDQDIRTFVENNQLSFQPGKGFYELTKRVLVQEGKEIVLRDRNSGDMFTGDEARQIAGIPKGQRGKIGPEPGFNYDVFIQSTSFNRKLLAGTEFLYEVDLTN